MLSKIKAAIMFAQSKEGMKSLIASLDNSKMDLIGIFNTTITNDISF